MEMEDGKSQEDEHNDDDEEEKLYTHIIQLFDFHTKREKFFLFAWRFLCEFFFEEGVMLDSCDLENFLCHEV